MITGSGVVIVSHIDRLQCAQRNAKGHMSPTVPRVKRLVYLPAGHSNLYGGIAYSEVDT